ncbi:MAG: acetylxylan esterase [Acidobacteria bacterium]|nr:acetylxylan esterase [Acidobacteriota bacterium]
MTRILFLLALFSLCLPAAAQRADVNYDEAKVPKYVLPDPLVLADGKPVRDARTWNARRRPEILELFRSNVYGRSPARPEKMTFELAEIDPRALGGKAVRKQIVGSFSDRTDSPRMGILLYLPAGAKGPVPVFLGLNFGGNHTVNADPGIRLGQVWQKGVKQAAVETARGAAAHSWQVEMILACGYGVASIYYGDIEPDFNGGKPHGVRALYPGETGAESWGSIGAWAWGLSRAMDCLVKDKAVDAKRVALMGHSRLGKTALWAGAEDTRFALVISNDSGEGGASLARRKFGERVKNLNTSFPHWFCANYTKFNDREEDLPIDQHMLIALIAPRPVYVCSAQEDQWADPRGEFLAAAAAGPVYQLLGKKGLGTDRMPGVHEPIMNTVGYHIRAGKHDVTAYDWERFLDFADKHLAAQR